jgi:putative membrane protein
MILTKPTTAMSFLATFVFAAAASAQQPSMPQQSSPMQQQQQTTPANPALQPADNSSPGLSMPNYADQAFVEDTLKNNEAQVQMSQLAQQKASSADVKDFSQRMIQIHTQLNQQLAPLAKQLDVSQNQKPSKEQKKEIAQLEQLSGPDFDSAYLQAMARAQARSLKQFKSEQSAANPNIQKAAKLDEPVLDQHYQILQKLAQTHNVTLDAKE